MKNMKKLTAMLLTLVMSLALAVPCFAAGPAGENEVYRYDLGNGVTAVITVQPAENVPKPCVPEVDVSGTASPSKTLRYTLNPSDGTFCETHTMNMAPLRSGIDMSVYFTARFDNGQKFSPQSFTVAPRMVANVKLTDNTGNGLDCEITINIAAVNAESVDYNYWHFQR